MSSTAILAYGYVWDEELPNPWTLGDTAPEDVEHEEWEDRFARLHGLVRPEEGSEDMLAYMHTRRLLIDKLRIEVGVHCSEEVPMPYVAISRSVHTVDRGDIFMIPTFKVAQDWAGRLKDFCTVMGIPLGRRQMGWFMVCFGDG